MSTLSRRPSRNEEDKPPPDDRLPLRWAVIGLAALGAAAAAAAAGQPVYIAIGLALTAAAVLHSILGRGQDS
jgi:hypothetical protein